MYEQSFTYVLKERNMPRHRHAIAPRETRILRNFANGTSEIDHIAISNQDLLNAIRNEEAFNSLNPDEKRKLLRQLPNNILFQVMANLPIEIRKAEALSRNN